MDLPDCPPGAEGYEDTVTEVPKKAEEEGCTKAEQEFQEHLNSLKIKTEDGETRCMVERKGRDISGKWIYLCYPCGAVCSGESILQMHVSGKKHKAKLAMCTTWPNSIFEDHHLNQKQTKNMVTATQQVLQKMAEEVDIHKKNLEDLEEQFEKYRNIPCYIQKTIDLVKAPLPGIEYLIEHPSDTNSEPSYLCVLCNKQGHPRTIINHMTSYWHRVCYIQRHLHKAYEMLGQYRNQLQYREGVNVVVMRLAQRLEDTYGRQRPLHITKEDYERNKEAINTWIHRGDHFKGKEVLTFEDVVDIDLIESLRRGSEGSDKQDPPPPVVNTPSKPTKPVRNQRVRAQSIDSLSDISDDEHKPTPAKRVERPDSRYIPKHEPHKWRAVSPHRSKYTWVADKKEEYMDKKAPNYNHKVALAEVQVRQAEESAEKTLRYHEKNPEKHPLYPEEWKKFWNKRYKQIQAEGKDPSKHDFKSEWIVFWTKRMKELHDEELEIRVAEVYRRMRLSPPRRHKQPEMKKRSSVERQKILDKRRSISPGRRGPRRRSPDPRRRSPEVRRRSPDSRRRTPDFKRDFRRDRPMMEHRRSPEHSSRSRRSRSPYRMESRHSRSPLSLRMHSPLPLRVHSPLSRRSRSPLSRRSRSPLSRRAAVAPLRNRSPAPPSLQTVLISDDEFKPDDLSPWNSDDMESSCSMPRSRRGPSSSHSRAADLPAGMSADPQDLGPPENVVATLRLLVALEDYLGSLGPKIIDLLAEALKMEKERPNSSEELLDRESAVVLMETVKEKLKGSVQAGLVPPAAAPAARAALLRAARTLHAADTRSRRREEQKKTLLPSSRSFDKDSSVSAVPVAGVGAVDRAQIAAQLAAALVAQGKTDVSAEELAQLVDAVVGMAEAKRRAAAAPTAPADIVSASALELLQSAYDDNEKKLDKEDPPDAMDGLSDSDLETLLKNFNELSAEEQHSLIAYLKKLEAREPQRVERLRQYVDAPTSLPERPAPIVNKPVTIESDDDDYTVDEVFQSATKKVKEDQMRQEMEIVKKSLEETKTTQEKPKENLTSNLSNSSSAAGLLALVQASIQSTSTTVTTLQPATGITTSNLQPKSFGDSSEPPPKLQTPQNIPGVPQWSPVQPNPPLVNTELNVYNQPRNAPNQASIQPINQPSTMYQQNTHLAPSTMYQHQMNQGPNPMYQQPMNQPRFQQPVRPNYMGNNDGMRPPFNQQNNIGHVGNMRPRLNQPNSHINNTPIPSLMDIQNRNPNPNYNDNIQTNNTGWNQQPSDMVDDMNSEGNDQDYFSQQNYNQGQGNRGHFNSNNNNNFDNQQQGHPGQQHMKKFRGRGRGGGRGKFGPPRGRGRGRGAPH